jgi:hypothetical protein
LQSAISHGGCSENRGDAARGDDGQSTCYPPDR